MTPPCKSQKPGNVWGNGAHCEKHGASREQRDLETGGREENGVGTVNLLGGAVNCGCRKGCAPGLQCWCFVGSQGKSSSSVLGFSRLHSQVGLFFYVGWFAENL